MARQNDQAKDAQGLRQSLVKGPDSVQWTAILEVNDEAEFAEWLKDVSSEPWTLLKGIVRDHDNMVDESERYAERVGVLEEEVQNAGREAAGAGRDLRTMQQELDAKTIELAEQAGERSALRRMVDRAYEEIATLKTRALAGDSRENSPAPEGTGRAIKFPDPKAFDKGTNAEYQAWERQMKSKLRYNATFFEDEGAMVAYSATRIEGLAAMFMEPHLREDSANRIDTMKAFFERMQTRFADPHEEDKAKDDFYKLYQNNKELADFLGEFHQLATIGCIPEKEQIRILPCRCNSEIQASLLGKRFDSLKDLMEQLSLIERQLKLYRKTARTATNTTPKAAAKTSTTRTTETHTTAKAAGETTGVARTRQPLSEVKCYNCNKLGHFARKCPEKEAGKVLPLSQS